MKPGYKQTEVGVIPVEWEVMRLGECVRSDAPICYGILMPGPHCNDGVPVVKVRDINEGRIDESALLLAHPSIDEAYKRSRLLHGDVLITIRGTTGRVAITSAALKGANITQDTARIRLGDRVSTKFIYYELQSEAAQKYVLLHTIGQAVKGINIRDVRTLTVTIPPLPEQRAIATALSDVDALLGGLDRLIAKKRDLKQAAMQQLLTGQTRLPGFSGEWEVRVLKNIVQTPVTDGPHLTPQFLENGIPFLSVNNLVGNRIDFTDLRFISREDHEVFSRKCRPRKNDILLGKAASVGKVALVELDIEFNIWSPIAMVRTNFDNAPRFVYYQLQSTDLIKQITLLTNSSSQGNIGMGDIEKLTLKLPPLTEQTAIAEVLTEMDAELAVLEQRREKTRSLKQAMMQELLTGRTRLVSPEVAHA